MPFGIFRQRDTLGPLMAGDVSIHVHPFDTLPVVTSHVHPKFVLLHLTHQLALRASDAYIVRLLEGNSLARKIAQLGDHWLKMELPTPVDIDVDPLAASGDVWAHWEGECACEWEYESSDGDSVCTTPRRIWYPPVVES